MTLLFNAGLMLDHRMQLWQKQSNQGNLQRLLTIYYSALMSILCLPWLIIYGKKYSNEPVRSALFPI